MAGLTATDINKSFDNGREVLEILRSVSLALSPGEQVAIVGPSGSGKSTLLHILGGLDQPTRGTVKLDDVEFQRLRGAALAQFRNEKIGFIFQEHYLLPQLTALENVLVPCLARGTSSMTQVAAARQLLAEVGLSERTEHLPRQLSGGERQRVAVARALILNPVLVLADEPTGSLDEANAGAIGDLLCSLPTRRRVMLVCVTHSSNLAARFERQLELANGILRAARIG